MRPSVGWPPRRYPFRFEGCLWPLGRFLRSRYHAQPLPPSMQTASSATPHRRETFYASLGRRAIFDDMRFLWILVGLGDFDLHQLAVDRIASWRLQFLDAVCSPGQLSELYEAVIISGQRGEQLIGAIIKAELRPRERLIRFGIHLFDHDAGKGIRNEEGPGHPAGLRRSQTHMPLD